ncbi:hypothetical protein [Brochothrix campestris]|uniref:Uncharacterized protein n=1 Tax=Brochothrix campestris FSL F6-1037 TaxID=1265861 RepID=W7CMA1_9LIST|nr:hypothetical protein [Brochothrix campestris]EUJ34258.1 hypothetical protein BCAMP_12321 [Brochothrix campestris FSL F6-1037]
MEYKGKQYEEVTDCSAEIGDLLQPSVDMELPDGHSVADYEKDSFKRYREIKKNRQRQLAIALHANEIRGNRHHRRCYTEVSIECSVSYRQCD